MYKHDWRTTETNYVPTASYICGVKTEHSRFIHIKDMSTLTRHTESVTSPLRRAIPMGESTQFGHLSHRERRSKPLQHAYIYIISKNTKLIEVWCLLGCYAVWLL
jgi:hypothetical protein